MRITVCHQSIAPCSAGYFNGTGAQGGSSVNAVFLLSDLPGVLSSHCSLVLSIANSIAISFLCCCLRIVPERFAMYLVRPSHKPGTDYTTSLCFCRHSHHQLQDPGRCSSSAFWNVGFSCCELSWSSFLGLVLQALGWLPPLHPAIHELPTLANLFHDGSAACVLFTWLPHHLRSLGLRRTSTGKTTFQELLKGLLS